MFSVIAVTGAVSVMAVTDPLVIAVAVFASARVPGPAAGIMDYMRVRA